MSDKIPVEFQRFPAHWRVLPFLSVFHDGTSGHAKVKQNEYLPAGPLAVVDQGQSPVGGYTADETARCQVDLPVVLFGDHTTIFKWIDFPFALGADGVKVLLLHRNSGLDLRFAFHYLRQLQFPDVGYSRHFKFLKQAYVPVPPPDEQASIVAILDQVDRVRRNHLAAAEVAGDLAEALAQRAFRGEL